MTESLSYKTPVFEGPLDLLLHLIAKNRLNICEIRISSLLEQYLEQIAVMQAQNLDVASEFLEMASRLVQIKSAFLLPRHEAAEELEQELVGQLLEYQACKEMAQKFGAMFSEDRMVRQPEPIPRDPVYHRLIDRMALAEAYRRSVGNGKRFAPPPMEQISAIVSHRVISVGSQVLRVLRQLRQKGAVSYGALFTDGKEKSELVATFLAVLELIKGKRIRVEDTEAGSMVILQTRREPQ